MVISGRHRAVPMNAGSPNPAMPHIVSCMWASTARVPSRPNSWPMPAAYQSVISMPGSVVIPRKPSTRGDRGQPRAAAPHVAGGEQGRCGEKAYAQW